MAATEGGLPPLADIGAADRRLSERIAGGRVPRTADPTHLLGKSNGLPTWFATAGLLAALGERGRRAAAHAAVAATSGSLLNRYGFKPRIGRKRPKAATRTTPSLPSGHATTGSAFATAVALEWPSAAPLCVALSVMVSIGRVRDGEHHLLDVVAGTVLGAIVAVAVRPVVAAGLRAVHEEPPGSDAAAESTASYPGEPS